jgi:hypothetical protein
MVRAVGCTPVEAFFDGFRYRWLGEYFFLHK